MKRRLLAGVLTLVMVLSLLPTAVLAENEEPAQDSQIEEAQKSQPVETQETKVTPQEVTVQTASDNALSEGESGVVVDHGTCGATGNEDSVTWTLTKNEDGEDTLTLTLSGTGATADYEYGGVRPWKDTADKITRCVVKEGITYVGARNFQDTAMKTVSLPASLESMADIAFGTMHYLESITLAAGNTSYMLKDGVLFTADGKTLIKYPPKKTDTVYHVADGVTTLGWHAFSCAANLTELTLPDSLTKIGKYCFEETTGVSTLKVPNSVTEIEDAAFYKTGIETVIIGSGVNSIGNQTFRHPYAANTEKIKTLVFMGNSASLQIGATAFENRQLETLVLPYTNISTVSGDSFKNASCDVFYVGSAAAKEQLAFNGVKTYAILNGGYIPANTVFESGKLATPVKDDDSVVFSGWYTKDGTSGDWGDRVDTPAANQTYYARWAATSGTCGESGHESDVLWALTENTTGYTLTISAKEGVTTANMADFTQPTLPTAEGANIAPWYTALAALADENDTVPITEVVVTGVSNIGAFTFNGLSAVASYDIDSTVTTIGRWGIDAEGAKTFELNGNTNFTVVDGVLMTANKTTLIAYPGGADAVDEYVIPASVTTVASGAFVGCDAQKLVIPYWHLSMPYLYKNI